jgi:nicotinamide-nucleotide amidase
MDAELLTIGSELISGATLNTNAAYLAQTLSTIGLPCRRQVSVGDERADLANALRDALCHADVLVVTGGLGPTFDDLTMEVIADVTQRPLTYRSAVAAIIRRFYTRRNRTLQRAALRQAYLPQGGEPIPNPIGTAAGLWLPLRDQLLIALPGVPREMRAMVEQFVLPRLKRLGGGVIESRVLRTVGVVELAIQKILDRIRIPPTIQIGLYPHLGMVDIRLKTTGPSRTQAGRRLARIESALRRRLGTLMYGTDDETLEGAVGALLVRRRKTLAVAESCTGGLLSDYLTNVPGSSRYFLGSVVAYHNDVKQRELGVPASVLSQYGAVSAQTARWMAEGIRRATGADVGLSVTGIAGPSGGTKVKPVGLVYFGIADGTRQVSRRDQFYGDRASIKVQAAQTALDWLRHYLLGR